MNYSSAFKNLKHGNRVEFESGGLPNVKLDFSDQQAVERNKVVIRLLNKHDAEYLMNSVRKVAISGSYIDERWDWPAFATAILRARSHERIRWHIDKETNTTHHFTGLGDYPSASQNSLHSTV